MKPEMIDELISASDNRQAIYSFLARTYAVEFTAETLKELAENRGLWSRLAEGPEIRGTELAEGFKTLAEFAAKLNGSDLETARLELAVEYAGLFLGVRQVPPHPSESVYTGKGRLLMQKPRDDVMKIYRRMGLERSSEFNEPEDHIAVELQFMADLSGKSGEALRTGDLVEAKNCLEVQRDFVSEHLIKWVPMLAKDILRGAQREFYKAIAKITEGYVRIDRDVLVQMIDGLPLPRS